MVGSLANYSRKFWVEGFRFQSLQMMNKTILTQIISLLYDRENKRYKVFIKKDSPKVTKHMFSSNNAQVMNK